MDADWQRRFWDGVDRGSDNVCWNWNRSVTRHGYGSIRFNSAPHCNHSLGVHTVAYRMCVGPVPDGIMVLHDCGNRRCCNPRHLYLGTAQDNANDRERDGRTTHGLEQHNARLTESQVVEIRRRMKAGEPAKYLAVEYGITQPSVRCAGLGLTWKHLNIVESPADPPGRGKWSSRYGYGKAA
uniref:Putative homing endonuclease n=1 Tax=viral metagenome TaxID=1070528 RepID=A0A6M3J2R7_9ZZZZ